MRNANIFTPKPFVFSDQINSQCDKVYAPQRHMLNCVDGKHTCVCTHICSQFLTYPVTKWGIRIIPVDIKCKFDGRCHGSRLLENGKPINKNIDLPYGYISGLTNPGR